MDCSGPMNKFFVEANVSTSEGTFFKLPLSDMKMIIGNSYINLLIGMKKVINLQEMLS